jgi:hypothetical protein
MRPTKVDFEVATLARAWGFSDIPPPGRRIPTVWRRYDIDALLRKGLKRQVFLIWVSW